MKTNAVTDADSYLMESPAEAERLEAKTDDALSERLLRQVGLEPGMRVLDAGAGTGAVARVMRKIVGPSGSVVAMDRSKERLEHGRRLSREAGLDDIQFLEGDLAEGRLQGSPYDVVWCRFVFEYLPDPDRVLGNLVRSVRVGGTVAVGDLDGNGTLHYPIPPSVEAGLTRVLSTIEGRFDPFAGRKLYDRFRRQRLEEIRVRAEAYHLYAGAAPSNAIANWEQKLRTIRPWGIQALGTDAAYDAWAATFLSLLRDPDSFTYSVLLMVQGKRAP